MKFLLPLVLLCLPLYAYDAKAVYPDYALASQMYSALMEADEKAVANGLLSMASIGSPGERASFIEEELLPRAKGLAAKTREIRSQFKSKEAAAGFHPGFSILEATEELCILLIEALRTEKPEAFSKVTVSIIAIGTLEEERRAVYENFTQTLKKEMKKARMPQSSIDGVK